MTLGVFFFIFSIGMAALGAMKQDRAGLVFLFLAGIFGTLIIRDYEREKLKRSLWGKR